MATARIRQKKHLDAAEGFLELALPQHALIRLEVAEREGPRTSDFYYLQGETLRQLNRCEEALAALTRAADIAPSSLRVWLALGACHRRLGRLDRAIESLERASEVDEASPVVQYNLACFFSLAGKNPQALGHLARALALEPAFRGLLNGETDFDGVRADAEFQALTEAGSSSPS
jgi:tetratricopeptide (TPR) repeat protein